MVAKDHGESIEGKRAEIIDASPDALACASAGAGQPVGSRAAPARCAAGRPPPLAGILTEGVAAQVGVRANEVVGGVAHEVGRADGEGSKVVDAAAVDGGGSCRTGCCR